MSNVARLDQLIRSAEKFSENSEKRIIPSFSSLSTTVDAMKVAQLHPRCIVENYLYADVAQLVAPGGTGKTTQVLHEMACIALGWPVWGMKVVNPGRSILITAEDSAELCYARLWQVMQGMELNDTEIQTVIDNVVVWDVSGEEIRLIRSDHRMITLTSLADELSEAFKDEDIRLITFDPVVSFGASESAVNDDAQGLILAARRIRNKLNCCVRYVAHTSQEVARNKIMDMYASRGGTASADGSRMVAVLAGWDEGNQNKKHRLPATCDLRDGDTVTMMSRPKLSYCPLQPLLFIRRRGYHFEHFTEEPKLSNEERDRIIKNQICQWVTSQVTQGKRHNKTGLISFHDSVFKIPRALARTLVEQLISEQRLISLQLPDEEKQGSRKYYLDIHKT